MMERFCNKYNKKTDNNVGYKWRAEFVSGFKEAADENPVEQTEYEHSQSQGKKIGVHQRIAEIYNR